MVNEGSETTASFPPDWWQRLDYYNQRLVDFFTQFLLALRLEVLYQDQRYHCVFSGFYVEFPGSMAWITAGHVIFNSDKPQDSILGIKNHPEMRICRARWIDRSAVYNAEELPVDLTALQMYTLEDLGIDFGIALITPFYMQALDAGGYATRITQQKWHDTPSWLPEGYCILGYPMERTEKSTKAVQDAGYKVRTLLPIPTCLPVRKLSRDDPRLSGKRIDPELFLGEILSFVDAPHAQPRSIVGMSGGPVFAIARNPDGRTIDYQLAGIQSGWFEQTRITTVEPTERIMLKIEALQQE